MWPWSRAVCDSDNGTLWWERCSPGHGGGSNHSITGKLWPHDITFKMEETRTATLTCDQLFLKNVCREFQPLAPKSDRGQDNGGSQNKHIWVIGHKEQTCLEGGCRFKTVTCLGVCRSSNLGRRNCHRPVGLPISWLTLTFLACIIEISPQMQCHLHPPVLIPSVMNLLKVLGRLWFHPVVVFILAARPGHRAQKVSFLRRKSTLHRADIKIV